jgi:hypothetical protein
MLTHAAKGSHITQVKKFVDAHLSTGTFARFALRAGGDETWDIVSVNAWYDAFVLQRVLEAVSREMSRSVVSIATEVARANALADLTSIYRMFMRIAQPQRMLYFTPQLWRNYVSFGDSRAIRNDPGAYVGETKGVPVSLLDWVCGNWLGFIPAGIELAGGVIRRAEITERAEAGDQSRVAITIDYVVKGH